jgi:hypothetical protein
MRRSCYRLAKSEIRRNRHWPHRRAHRGGPEVPEGESQVRDGGGAGLGRLEHARRHQAVPGEVRDGVGDAQEVDSPARDERDPTLGESSPAREPRSRPGTLGEVPLPPAYAGVSMPETEVIESRPVQVCRATYASARSCEDAEAERRFGESPRRGWHAARSTGRGVGWRALNGRPVVRGELRSRRWHRVRSR